MALQRLRLDPASLVAGDELMQVIYKLKGTTINDMEVMPDAAEQHHREARVAALATARLLQRPETEWPSAFPNGMPISRAIVTDAESQDYLQRGLDLKELGRDDQARRSFKQAIEVDPNSQQAAQQLQ
jgi:tetratricopeptide (TPR) repeat protein